MIRLVTSMGGAVMWLHQPKSSRAWMAEATGTAWAAGPPIFAAVIACFSAKAAIAFVSIR